jgi:hypothetical protein
VINDILEKGKHLKVDEKRSMREDYAEFVIFVQDLEEWDKVLSGLLGTAVKPIGKKPTPEEQTMTDEYGGIQRDQLLYFQANGDTCLLAMLWPWRDKVHITVKVARIKKPKA